MSYFFSNYKPKALSFISCLVLPEQKTCQIWCGLCPTETEMQDKIYSKQLPFKEAKPALFGDSVVHIIQQRNVCVTFCELLLLAKRNNLPFLTF